VRITIPLSDASCDALRRMAYESYRDPKMQAKFLLEQAIRERAGALPTDDERLTTGSPDPVMAT
jgi:hypothetical protein